LWWTSLNLRMALLLAVAAAWVMITGTKSR
jgi:hypothetical protein